MAKSHLRLVAHEAEVERLMKAATGNRHGHRDATRLESLRVDLTCKVLTSIQGAHVPGIASCIS